MSNRFPVEYLTYIGGSWNGDVWHCQIDKDREIQYGKMSRGLFIGEVRTVFRFINVKFNPSLEDILNLIQLMGGVIQEEHPWEVGATICKIKYLCSATKHEIQGSSVLLFRDEVQIGGFSLRDLYAAISLGKDATEVFVTNVMNTISPMHPQA